MKPVFRPVVRPLVRSMAGLPLAVAAAAALAVVALTGLRHGSATAQLFALRGAAVILCSAVAFVIDDPADPCLASSPTPLAIRRGMRVAFAGVFFALVWAGATQLAGPGVPLVGVTLEAAAMLVFTLAVSACVEAGGAAGGPALALALLGTFVFQQRWPRWFIMLTVARDPVQRTAAAHWLVVLAVSAGVLAASGRDPAGRARLCKARHRAHRGDRPRR